MSETDSPGTEKSPKFSTETPGGGLGGMEPRPVDVAVRLTEELAVENGDSMEASMARLDGPKNSSFSSFWHISREVADDTAEAPADSLVDLPCPSDSGTAVAEAT